MDNQTLFLGIVNRGRAEEVLGEIRAFGVGGGTVFHGEGTAPNRWLEWLGLEETQKDVILLPIPQRFEAPLHEMMIRRFQVNKKHRGIAFSMPLSRSGQVQWLADDQRYDPKSFPYHCIFVILDAGRSRDCVKVARQAGAGGGTIIHGRGGGVPAGNYFETVVRPDKDIVMLLCPSGEARKIHEAIVQGMSLEKPGQGILFALPVSRASGLYEATGGKVVGE